MDSLLYYIVELIVTILTLVLARYIIPLVKAKTDEALQSSLGQEAIKAVRSARQLYGISKESNDTKREYATLQIKAFCDKKGIEITEDQVRALLEGAYDIIKQEAKKTE